MARGLFVLAAVTLCIAVAAGYEYKETTDQTFLLKQKRIYNLFYHVPQPEIVNPEDYKAGKTWDIQAKIDYYSNRDAVQEFLKMYKNGMLPRGAMFSVYYPKLLKESVALYRLFFYAKDFDTFFYTALWARIHVNEGTFLCALHQAVFHRPDTEYLQVPPPYEYYPYAFFNIEVLDKARNARVYRDINYEALSQKPLEANVRSDSHNAMTIHANYSGWYIGREYDAEMKLNYFIEDIGLNTFYFYLKQAAPFWLHSKECGWYMNAFNQALRGEDYLYGHKLLLTRYNLERLANGLEDVEDFDWNSEFYPGYYPTMTYHNGLPFTERPHWSHIPHYKFKHTKAIKEMETRVAAAIDLGYVFDTEGKKIDIYKDDGLNMVGNIIEGNVDSPHINYYGSIDAFGRKILGYNLEPIFDHQILPSALESFASCVRDPAFYRLYKRINGYYMQYKSHLKPYEKSELVFPDLKITSITTDPLTTYWDDFDTVITNGLLVANQKEADKFLVKVRQQRLNHKPFTVRIGINAAKSTKVAIQIFLGPKVDAQGTALDFTQNYKNFYELDNWVTELTAGTNKLERKCDDFSFTYPDQMSSDVFYKKILKALDGGDPLKYQERIYGFPQRLILPKGSKCGTAYQLFVYVQPIEGDPAQYTSRVWGKHMFAKKSMGFPLDRPVDASHFVGPNINFKDVVIFHKNLSDDFNATI